MSHHIPLDRKPKDIDILGNYDEIISFIKSRGKSNSITPFKEGKKLVAKQASGEIIEAEIDWGHGSPNLLYDIVSKDPETIIEGNLMIPSLDVLYAVKMSHRYLKNSPFFEKTFFDIKLMRQNGAVLKKEHEEFFKLREKETYNYKHPNLNQKKNQFFREEDKDIYLYQHDDIHESVKIGEKPAYEYYKADNSEVMCSKSKWDACDFQIKLNGAIEEVRVLSLERSIIPFKGKVNPKNSYKMAAQKISSSISSGYFREFCWEHYEEILAAFNEDYINKFWEDVDNGKVKLHAK